MDCKSVARAALHQKSQIIVGGCQYRNAVLTFPPHVDPFRALNARYSTECERLARLIFLPLEVLMSRPSPTLLIVFIAMSQVLVFSQSASVATLEREKPTADLIIKNTQPAKEENCSGVTAAKLVAEGLRIEEPATADSRRKAIEKYLEAIPLWQAAKDTAAEAKTLALIASAYINLGEKQNAFDFANRALPLSEKALKECSEQEQPAAVRVKAYVLDTTGRANQEFGDKKKASELYNEAISLSSSINDRTGEASSLINLARVTQFMSDYPKALALAERARVMVEELGDRRKQAMIFTNM